MPAHHIGARAMTQAERQAHLPRASCAAAPGSGVGRQRRWAAAVATLLDLQDDYRAWLDNLPENLEGSRLAEKLQAITEIDLDELQAVDPPRGYGRD